jgi:transposase
LLEQDESWFHRFVQPHVQMWMDREQPVKLVQQTPPSGTKDKAISCFGALCQELAELFLDFAQGYPNSEQMWAFIVKLLALARRLGRKVLVLIWDNAPWHTSKRIRQWIHWYNQAAKYTGDVRLLVFWLPTKSPWLNPIEPHWGHAKRHVCEPSGELETRELKQRICAYFGTQPLAYVFTA